jgi:hypothetical protein
LAAAVGLTISSGGQNGQICAVVGTVLRRQPVDGHRAAFHVPRNKQASLVPSANTTALSGD